MKKFLLSALALIATSSAMADITIEQVAGYYTETYSVTGDGYYVYSYTDQKDTVVISKTSETTVAIKGMLGSKESLEGIVDLTAKTITVAPQTILSYYTFCKANETDPVIISIADDGTLSFEGAQLSCYNDTYGSNVKSTMVRYADNDVEIKTLFSVPALVICYDEETKYVFYKGTTTITKTEGTDYPYTLVDYAGTGKQLQFTTDADGRAIFDAQFWGNCYYLYYQYWCGNDNDYLELNYTESELSDEGEKGGYMKIGGYYMYDYDKWDTTGHSMYYCIFWGDQIAEAETAIRTIQSEQNASATYGLNGRRAAAGDKGLLIRDGRTIFVK